MSRFLTLRENWIATNRFMSEKEKEMKKMTLGFACFGFLIAICFGVSVAQEKATKDECLAKVKEAAALIREVGFEAAKVKLADRNGAFVWKDSYVFVEDMDGTVLVHPVTPKLEGKSLRGISDSNGKMFNAEIVQLAASAGEGWVSYMWPRPNEKEPSSKMSYVYRVPGQNLILVAGFYQ